MTTEGVFAAARKIRPYLPDMLGREAGDVDTEIEGLLSGDSSGEEAEGRLRELLESRIETRMFLNAVLVDGPLYRTPQEQSDKKRTRAFQSQAGDPGEVDADAYRCPEEDHYQWSRISVGAPVPRCPEHGCVLVPVLGG